ncbi:hypothetical protein BaRGS_00010441, partial [Batillaria attramentaria]
YAKRPWPWREGGKGETLTRDSTSYIRADQQLSGFACEAREIEREDRWKDSKIRLQSKGNYPHTMPELSYSPAALRLKTNSTGVKDLQLRQDFGINPGKNASPAKARNNPRVSQGPQPLQLVQATELNRETPPCSPTMIGRGKRSVPEPRQEQLDEEEDANDTRRVPETVSNFILIHSDQVPSPNWTGYFGSTSGASKQTVESADFHVVRMKAAETDKKDIEEVTLPLTAWL